MCLFSKLMFSVSKGQNQCFLILNEKLAVKFPDFGCSDKNIFYILCMLSLIYIYLYTKQGFMFITICS